MKIFFVSLGCDKNLVDSEVMLGILRNSGHEFTSDEAEAEAIIINTCGFINDAKEESINTILEMANYKIEAGNGGKCKVLIATGCLAQRYADEICKEIPEVDAVVGTTAYDEIAQILDNALLDKHLCKLKSIDESPKVFTNRIITEGGYYSYLKIAEGCDKHCTYCIIPKLRGKFRSVPMEDLIKEAEYLVECGVSELILVAQETSLYGIDLYGKKMLPKLLKKLCEIENLHWIRLLYCYPEEITDELISVISEEKKICKYIDMPIQHASDNVLKRMGRRATREGLLEVISKMRKQIPGLVIRTTLISGFPGETEENHRELMEFVESVKFERLGVFTYSPEEGTPSAEFSDQIPDSVKNKRRDEIMLLQQKRSSREKKKINGSDYQGHRRILLCKN